MTLYPEITYVSDASVDAALDHELRELLAACFTKPEDRVFKERRYFNELPAHRWVIRDEAGALVAHIAVHDKRLFDDRGGVHRTGGIAEVCVHPSHRGRGYVKLLVAAAHDWMRAEGFVFSVLFGISRNYASSGYLPVDNLFLDANAHAAATRAKASGALAVAFTPLAWPEGEAHLPGPSF